MAAYSPLQWTDLFVASAGASAALTGLVFVAVSINIERILKVAGLPERALETVLLLLGVTIVSLLGLAPAQSRGVLGLELLGESFVCLAAVALLVRASLRQAGDERPGHMRTRIVTAAPGVLPFLIGSLSLLADAGGGLYWTFAGMLGALVGAVVNAWVLLVEILR